VTPSASEGETPRILLFFDYACSFCYVDGFRFRELEDEFGVELVHVPYELRPGIAEQGISAKEHGLAHSEHVDAHLERMASEGGFPLIVQDHLPNTHLALVMAERARDEGLRDAVHDAIFHAYFGEGRDIGDRTVLLDVAERAGMDVGELRRAWDDGRYEERLRSFAQLGESLGITSTPSALICDELVIGSRPYAVLREAVDRCLVTEESLSRSEEEGDGEGASPS
jgi:predicted DsbA family dithiol-disulfide isomerase